VLQSADPDEYRTAVRDAAFTGQPKFTELLGRPQALTQPARYAAILGLIPSATPDRRRAILGSALRARPGDLSLLMELGQSYPPNQRDPDGVRERVRWFQAAVAARPENAAAHNQLGLALRHKGDLAEAVAEFRRAVDLEPKNPVPHYNLGNALVAGGTKASADEALVHLQAAVDLAPKRAIPLVSLGMAQFGMRNREEGIATLRRAVELDEKNARAYAMLGAALSLNGQRADAIRHLRNGARHHPKDSEVLTALGIALMDSKDEDIVEAVDLLTKAVESGADNDAARYALGNVLATGPDRVRDGRRAVTVATQACELTKWKNPSYLATLAAAYAEVGEFDRAVEFQKKALDFPDYKKSFGPGGEGRLRYYEQKKPIRDPRFARVEIAPLPRARP
jgi:Flp pilus assembly protein TadD